MAEIYPKLDYGKLTDKGLVQRFVDAGFKGIELYTSAAGPNSYNNFKDTMPLYGRTDLAVKSIHAPIWFPLDGKNEKFNLVYEDKVADKSLEVLADVTRFAKRHDCDELTIHSWFINPSWEISKKDAHVNMARNLAKIKSDLGNVRVLAEVSPMVLWGFPDIYDKQTVMVTSQDYQELFDEGDKHGLNLGWDADIDHMYRSAIYEYVFGSIYNYLAGVSDAKKEGREEEFREKACKEFLLAVNDDAKQTNGLAYSFIRKMLTKHHDRIGHVSVTGADFIIHRPYLEYNEGISFEHIPVGFKGEVVVRNYGKGFSAVEKTAHVEDRLDHSRYIDLVKDKPFVLEFMSRDETFGQKRKDYDFFEQAVKQKELLENLLA